MNLRVERTPIEGLLILLPRRFSDERGFFSESWNRRALYDAGVDLPEFVQDNHSFSLVSNTLRGLHFQSPPHAQGKLVRCGRGSLFDVAVDVRKGSATYGKWFGTDLSFENARQLWIPAGFLHGFVTRENDTEIIYKCTDHFVPECEGVVHWDSAGIDWSLNSPPVLSQKDALAGPLSMFESPFEVGSAG